MLNEQNPGTLQSVEPKKRKRFAFIMKNRILLLSFFLPVVILAAAYGTRGIFPFGPKSVLLVDLFHQYAPFLSELQDKLRSQSSLFFSWSGGLGMDFFSTFSYYLASPLNIILVLFPKSWLTEAILALTLIKIGLSGAFFSIYLKQAYGKKDLSVAAFSLMYALSGYALAYSWNIMWLEGIYLMPLIFLGLIRLIKNRNALLYTICMGLLLFSNFYIAFFIVLFTILYYPILLIQFLPEKNVRAILVKTLQVVGFSILAVGLAAVMILPTLSALRLTSASGESFPKDIVQYFNLFDYIGRHFPTADPVIREGLPNIYCGLAVLILAPVFFLSRRFSRADKVANAALLFVLISSFNLNFLNFTWHGFHFPNQLPFRNSLVYVFLLVTLSARALESRTEFSNRFWVGVTGILTGLLFLIQKLNDKKPGFPDIYLAVILIGVFAVVFTMRQDRLRSASRFVFFFLLAVALEITVSTILTADKIDNNEYYSTRNGYIAGDEVKQILQQVKQIKKEEKNFYRMEVLPPKTSNDPYLYNYNGVSIFSSMMPEKVVSTMENLGFHSNSINSYKYEGSTLPLDSLLGVKYLIKRTEKGTETLRTEIYRKDKLAVFENPYALSIGYLAPSAVKNWTSSYSSPFLSQNNLFEKLSGVKEVLKEAKTEAGSMTNVNVSQSGSNYFSFTRQDAGRESRISVKIKEADDKNLYLYLKTNANKIDYGYAMVGDRKIDFNAKRSTLVDLGFCEKGKAVSVELVYKADSDINGSFSLYADVLDEANFKNAIEIIKSKSLKVEQFADTLVKGTVNAETDGMLITTIPYHKGWSVQVDGKYVSTYAVDNGFLGFDIAAGSHTIEMNYMTPFFLLGGGITLLAIVVIMIGMLRRSRFFK